jgi:hypothetical protein
MRLIPQKGTTWPTPPTPTAVLAEHIAGVNAFGEDAIGAHLPTTGRSAACTGNSGGSRPSAARAARELAGDRVAVEVTEVLDQHGGAIVRGRYCGNCGNCY